MIGMNHTTGVTLEGAPHLNQSIGRLLSTPLGSRIARREYGSELFDLVAAPSNAATRLRMFAAVATALMRWEPRLKLERIGCTLDPAAPGTLVIEIEGITTISRERVNTSVSVNLGSPAS